MIVHLQSFRFYVTPHNHIPSRTLPAPDTVVPSHHRSALRTRLRMVSIPLLWSRTPAPRPEREQIHRRTFLEELSLPS
jgi:hypothetical protein